MEKHNLVVLKTTENLFWESDVLHINTVYRCLQPVESGDDDNYMIYGILFTPEEYDLYFELAVDRVIRDWTTFGIVTDGKLVSFAKFKKAMDIHTYGKQTNNLRIGFMGISKENFYKFYPNLNGNKELQLKDMYNMAQYVLEGNMYYLDNRCIQFGTFGAYASYVRK